MSDWIRRIACLALGLWAGSQFLQAFWILVTTPNGADLPLNVVRMFHGS